MSGWTSGHETIAALIGRGHLERITGASADGDYLLTRAGQRLASAAALVPTDLVAAFELTYDGVRLAATALLVQQGLRPKSEGGHVAVVEAVQAQFGDAFSFFGAMRRIRNKLEYPLSPNDLAINPATVQQAGDYAGRTIEAVGQMLPKLGIWQP